MKRIVVVTLALGFVVGCTPDEEKVQRVIERGLKECKEAEGPFAEITVVEGKDEMLKIACEKEISDLQLVDEYHATAKVGPYDWLIGIDSSTGVWTLTQVDWETLGEARRSIRGEDPPKDARVRAEKAFAKVQEEMPESEWIRKARIENLLAMRKVQRGKSEDPTALGDAGPILQESINWAEQNEKPALAAELRMMVIDYYQDYASKLQMAYDNIGSSDEHLEALIHQAEKDGNKEDLEKYTKTLEEARAGRDDEYAKMDALIAGAQKKACQYLAKLSPVALEGDLATRASGMKEATDCSPEALKGGHEEGAEGEDAE
jgi:hypothetical protein